MLTCSRVDRLSLEGYARNCQEQHPLGKGTGWGGRNERRAEDLLFTVYPSLLFEFLKPCTHKSFLRTLIQRTPLIRVFDFHGCSYPRSKNIKQKIPAISN